MRITRLLNITVLSTLVATSAAMYAQEEKPREAEPQRAEEPRPEPKQQEEMKAPKQEEAKPAQQGEMKPEKPQQEAKPSKDQEKAQKEQQKQQEKQTKEQMKQDKNHEQPAAARNNDNAGHPQGKSGRIPDDKFKSHFGQSHHFTVQRTTVIQGRPGFSYGGYSFQFVDAWPVGWAYTDDCYVDYIDGEYFLFDVLHPGVRIALIVIL